MKDEVYWAAIAGISQIGGKTVTKLLARFGTLPGVFTAGKKDLLAIKGIGEITAEAILNLDLKAMEEKLQQLKSGDIHLITWEDPQYPSLLLKAEDSPPVLFYKGSLPGPESRAAAIIGTRKPSDHGLKLAYDMAATLAKLGFVIVSGLALGIDSAAHRGALDSEGRTIAVLGSGISEIYPPENRHLANEIMKKGLLLCEVPPDARVSRQALAARNRITSGLSEAVIVVESEKDSGSLITVRAAESQGRKIFAFYENSSASSELEELGAIPLSADPAEWESIFAKT